LASAAFVAPTTHDPVPLFAVNWVPDTLHGPLVRLKLTAPSPLPPVVLSVSVALYVSGDPAFSVSAAWFAFCSVTVTAADVAALKLASAAFVAVTEHVPVPLFAVSWSPATEQLPAVTLYVTAPVPLPPLVVSVSVVVYVSGDPAFTVSVAWSAFTVCVRAGEVLVRKLPSPAYTAVIEWEPPESEDVVNVASPEALSVPVPRVVAPSLKVTVPVGVPTGLVTVAVNVTDSPGTVGVLDVATVVVVVARTSSLATNASALLLEGLPVRLSSGPIVVGNGCELVCPVT
jgi:hypothetical protein